MKRSAFGVPAFRRLSIAGLVSDTGDWLLAIALPLVVLQLTGSALGTSLAFLLELLPVVALAPLTARIVARFEPRRLMAVVSGTQALCLLPLLLVTDAASLPILYAVIAVEAGLASVFDPAKNTLLPQLVDPQRLVSANSLVGLNQNLGRLIGGPVAGLLLLVGHLPLIVAVDAASFAVSCILIVLLPAREPVGQQESVPGFHLGHALRSRRIRAVLVVALLAGTAQGLFLVLFVLFVIRRIHGGEVDVGLLRGIQAIGSLGAGAVLGFAAPGSARTLTVAGCAAFGVISLAVWNLPFLTTGIGWYVALFILVGAPGVLLTTGLVAALQLGTSEHERPAAFTAFGLVSAVGQGVGILLAGLADGGGLVPLLELQGCLYLAGGVAALFIARQSRLGLTARDTI